ncbi:hypothetical protein [Dyadobacter diqingensis]|uniref:hypothetical protein n=1 Tax=Dyadobacter diqingensis TaxID=2938121 RepID=UPI0020C1A7C7|nr:hypothetical protein [Dyadobacter diqingensis]
MSFSENNQENKGSRGQNSTLFATLGQLGLSLRSSLAEYQINTKPEMINAMAMLSMVWLSVV